MVAGRARRHEEQGEAILGAAEGGDEAAVLHAGVADVDLGAVDHPFVAVSDSAGADGGRIRAGVRFRNGAGADHLATDDGSDVLVDPSLPAIARGPQQRAGTLDADPEREPERGIDAADLFDGQAEGEGIGIAAAEFGRVEHPRDAEFAHAPVEGVVEPGGPVALLGAGGYLLACEIADRALDLELRLAVTVRVHLPLHQHVVGAESTC